MDTARRRAFLLAPFALFAGLQVGSDSVYAVPSFAIQTSQPCATCHIGSYGPQLTPQGRDFKLNGYLSSDGQDHGLPIAFTTQSSFTRTQSPQPGGAAPGFKPNDNVAFDQAALFYAGKISDEVGAFAKVRYNGIRQQLQLGNVDIRFKRVIELFGKEVLWGLTVNNNPTGQDSWNTTPAWAFPYTRSSLAPSPTAAPLVSGRLSQRVAGVGVYAFWNDWLYWEADVYKGLSSSALEATGQIPVNGNDRTTSFFPYSRIAVIRDWESHHLELGALGLFTDVIPSRNQTFGITTRKANVAFDATYQYVSDPTKVTSDRLSAHAILIREAATIDGSPVNGAAPEHTLNTFRFDLSYSFRATLTPSAQYFRTVGNSDVRYWSGPNGSPNSEGMIFEVAYVPWGKPDSPFPNLNWRLTAQYVSYLRFNGSSANARNNNTFFLSFQTAAKL